MNKVLLIFALSFGILSLSFANGGNNDRDADTTAFAKDSLELKALVYPNPFDKEINISGDSKIVGSTVFIYNAIGNEVKQYIIINSTETIDVTDLRKGLYFIKIVKDDKKIVKRIIKK